MYSLADICIFFLIILVIVYWWRTRDLHAIALRAARKYCSERDIQLLDETLMFGRFSLSSSSNGKRFFSRHYVFDFCRDGTDRHKGEIILRGQSVVSVLLEGDALEITQY